MTGLIECTRRLGGFASPANRLCSFLPGDKFGAEWSGDLKPLRSVTRTGPDQTDIGSEVGKVDKISPPQQNETGKQGNKKAKWQKQKERGRREETKKTKHTTPGIRWSSPTQLLVRPSLAYLWESGRDPEFSSGYGRMWLSGVWFGFINGDWKGRAKRRWDGFHLMAGNKIGWNVIQTRPVRTSLQSLHATSQETLILSCLDPSQ